MYIHEWVESLRKLAAVLAELKDVNEYKEIEGHLYSASESV